MWEKECVYNIEKLLNLASVMFVNDYQGKLIDTLTFFLFKRN